MRWVAYTLKKSSRMPIPDSSDALSSEQKEELRLKQLNERHDQQLSKLNSVIQAFSQQNAGTHEELEFIFEQMKNFSNLVQEYQNPKVAFEKQT
jgi:hypothetical protein